MGCDDTGMDPLDHPDSDHELVQWRRDPETELSAIIAIHDRSLGPAIGGCRIYPYASREAALTDVLRLSRGMTFKCAIGGIPYGGGKAVIIADPARDKTTALLHAMGRFVDDLGGKYITSFDSGTTLDDVRTIGEVTPHVGGIAEGFGNASQSTAEGVFTCMEASWRHLTGRDLAGARVAIQGLGNVGRRLAAMLHKAGARLIIADVDPRACEGIEAQITSPDMIHAADADIFAPNALGGVLNPATIPAIKARLVCGGANNQLASAGDAEALRERGILYCPDYLANAGGIIELHYQRGGGDHAALGRHLASLGDTVREVIAEAEATGATTAAVADAIALRRIEAARS